MSHFSFFIVLLCQRLNLQSLRIWNPNRFPSSYSPWWNKHLFVEWRLEEKCFEHEYLFQSLSVSVSLFRLSVWRQYVCVMYKDWCWSWGWKNEKKEKERKKESMWSTNDKVTHSFNVIFLFSQFFFLLLLLVLLLFDVIRLFVRAFR